MFRALDSSGERVLAEEAERGCEVFCPECGGALVFKKGEWVVAHFAHRADTGECAASYESRRHLMMKAQIRDLAGDVFIDYEVPVAPGHRADVVLKGDIVVECQASALLTEELVGRTRSYNDAGYRVLWVWDMARVAGEPELTRGYVHERRVPAEIRWWHRAAFGRLYALDAEGKLWACHLEKADPRDNDWDEGSGLRYPKTLRNLWFKGPLPGDEIVLRPYAGAGPESLRLVNCGERVWWK